MGFNLLGKKEKLPQKNFTDLNLMSMPAKQNAVLKYAAGHPDSIFIAWFTETAALFRGLFAAAGADEQRVVKAKNFSALKYPHKQVIFLEHFPLREKEELLVHNSEQQSFIVYNSLTEPFLLRQLIRKGSDFYNVKNEFNASETESAFADKHCFKGRGAGAFPTAAAVLNDIAALRYGYRYEYRKLRQASLPALSKDFVLNVAVSADDISKINVAAFARIDKQQKLPGFARLTRSIHVAELIAGDWWKTNNVSLILGIHEFALPEAVRKIKQCGVYEEAAR